MQQERRASGTTGPIVIGVGAIVALVSTTLPWHALVSTPSLFGFKFRLFTQDVAGTQGLDGKITIVCGVLALLAAGTLLLTRGGHGLTKAMAWLAIAAGVVAAAIAIADIVGKDAAFVTMFRSTVQKTLEKRIGSTPSGDQIDRFRELLGLSLALRAGIFVAIAGDLVAVVGGIATLAGSRRRAGVLPQVAGNGPAGYGWAPGPGTPPAYPPAPYPPAPSDWPPPPPR